MCANICVCVHAHVRRMGRGGGIGRDTSDHSRRVQDGKATGDLRRKDYSISPTAEITWYLQEVRLQRAHRGGKQEGWGRRGGWQEKIAELLQYVFTAFLLVGLYVRLLKRAHTSSACYHDPSDLPRNGATVSVTSQNQKPLYFKLFTLTWAPEKTTFFSMCSFVRFYIYTSNF